MTAPCRHKGKDLVEHSDWNKWKWRAVAAFVALGLANAFGFWLLKEERSDRIEQAATMIRVRCEDSKANRAALRRALEGMRQIVRIRVKQGSEQRAQAVLVLAELDRQIDLLPPIQNCARQAEAIRGLVD